jgi:hypothetical protein
MNSVEHLSQLSQYNSRGNSNHEQKQQQQLQQQPIGFGSP